MLHLENLRREGLEPVTLTLEAGQCIAVMGPSGSGKSLLLRAISDLDPSEGEVTLDGQSRNAMSGPAWRQKVMYVPAESGWWAEHVGDHMPDPNRAAAMAHRLGLTSDPMDWPVIRLSTGEKQRLALVRALCLSPRVLLLDEPTAALDMEGTAAVEGLIRERMEAGVAVLLVTHDKAQAKRLAKRTLTIRKGVLSDPEASQP
jgi:ABC-type iron transport system FetAB ATPase subunit